MMKHLLHQLRGYLIVLSLVFLFSSVIVNTASSNHVDMEIKPHGYGSLIFGTSGTITLIAFEQNEHPFSLFITKYPLVGEPTEFPDFNDSASFLYHFERLPYIHESINLESPGVFWLVCLSNGNVTLSITIDVIQGHISDALLVYSLFPLIILVITLIPRKKHTTATE